MRERAFGQKSRLTLRHIRCWMRIAQILAVACIFFPWTGPVIAAEPPLVILMPGGTGTVKAAGFLERNQHEFERAGFRILFSTTPQQAVRAAREAHAKRQRVFLVAISFGVARAATALESGAPVDAAVFFSGAYEMARPQLDSPRRLPPTLMVHHRQDRCPTTTPQSAEAFMRWSGGKVGRIAWISSSGNQMEWACGSKGAHGYFGKDAEPMSAAIAFLKRF
jgi:hypothetical protein